MREDSIIGNKKSSRWIMKWSKIPLLILLGLALIYNVPQAQIIDSVNYNIDLGSTNGLPGSVVKLPVKIKNATPIGAFLLRVEFDSTVIVPYDLGFYDPFVSPSILIDSVEWIERGTNCIVIDSIDFYQDPRNPKDTFYNVTATHDPGDDTTNIYFADRDIRTMFIQFIPPSSKPDSQWLFLWDTPYIPVHTGQPDDVLNILFEIQDSATVGSITYVTVQNYDPEGTPEYPEYRVVQFSDTLGDSLIRPGIGPLYAVGAVSVTDVPTGACCDPSTGDCTDGLTESQCLSAYGGTGVWHEGVTCAENPCETVDPDNDPPTVTLGGQNSYSILQGESVSFTVSAVDPDGDDLCLEALNLPGNATFTPSNPVCGSGTITGTFSWTPSFAQSGTFAITFRGEDTIGAIASTAVPITVEEIDVDRLYSTSTFGDKPVGGIPGATPIVFPIDLATSKTVYGIQFDMTYPGSVAAFDSIVVTDRIPEYVIYENIGDYPDSVRIVTFGLNNEPVESGSSTAILNAYFSLDSSAIAPADHWIKFYDAWESVDPNFEIPSLFLAVDSGIIQVDMLGDVNLDRHIDVADMVNIVGFIIGNYSFPKRNFETANIIQDTLVNVVDLVGIINTVFGYPIESSPSPSSYGDDFATFNIEHDELLAGQLTKLNISGELPDDAAGIQFQIDYDPEAFELSQPEVAEGINNFSFAYKNDGNGRLNLVLYSHQPWDENSLIKRGLSDIVRLPAKVKQYISAEDKSKIVIRKAYLANGNAVEIPTEQPREILPASFSLHQNYPNPFNPVTKIEFELGADKAQDVRLDVFNILGQKVITLVDDRLSTGAYSVTWEGVDKNGFKVASGIYLYRLEVGEESETRKMMLLK